MAGHSKWANIKFKKAAQDAKRGKFFTKLIREITVATKQGGNDLSSNPRLRAAVDKALSGNMTRDAIDRAIKRAAGGTDTSNYEEINYEGYGPNGVAVLVECLTDNKNRTVSDVRHAFTKHNGNLGTTGSVAYLFKKQGQFLIKNATEEFIMELTLDAGIEDLQLQDDGLLEASCHPDNFTAIKNILINNNVDLEFADLIMAAETNVQLDPETSETVIKLIDKLEDLDDVQAVHTNVDFSTTGL